MSNLKQYLIQYMIGKGISTEKAIFDFCQSISSDSVQNVKDLKLIITEINGEIVRNGLKLTYGRCEITNNKCIALINTKCDTIALLQSTFSPVQLEYFQAIISEILGSDEYRITFIICINITSTLVGKMTRDQGQNTLNVWIKGGYFIKDEDYVYLGLRTKMEFATYLRQHCPDSLCKLCSELVFRAVVCAHCAAVFHNFCINKYLESQALCPTCDAKWQTEAYQNHLEKHNGYTSMEVSDTESSQSTIINHTETRESDCESFTEEPGPSKRKVRRKC